MEFLEYSNLPPSRSALILGSTIKISNCHASLRLLIFSLSRHRPEETQVCWPWDMWCAEPQVNLRDTPVFVSDPVSSAYKSSIICFPSKKSLTLGILFSTSVKVFSFALFLGLTGSWIGCVLMIKVSGVFFILLLWGIWRVFGVSLDKLYPCPDKSETIKFSLWICISEGFSILILLLG